MILRAKKEFKEYFKGKRKSFTLPLCPEGTEFQKRTWKALLKVSYGTRASYGIVARSSGYPSAARAVGNAIGNNPIPIIIPCHRVVRKDGGLGGYSGGAVIKRKLLSHEARNASA
jgi:methylated-DNA-[protein]-cysteine S-methyltransferase